MDVVYALKRQGKVRTNMSTVFCCLMHDAHS
jgi:hypothetical protein